MICFRLLDSDDPATPLAKAVATLRRGEDAESVYAVNPKSFRQVPNAPFAYWVSERIRGLFRSLPRFENDQRTAKAGLCSGDDFRFIRTKWETDASTEIPGNAYWCLFVKGGRTSAFYADIYLCVKWLTNGAELKAGQESGDVPGARIQNTSEYMRPGLTWPSRPHRRGSFSIVSRNSIFSHTTPMVFDSAETYSSLCAVLSSAPYLGLLHLLMARGVGGKSSQTLKYEVGNIISVPVPKISQSANAALSVRTKSAWSLKRHLDTTNSNSHAFYAPALTPGQCTAPRLAAEPGGTC